ERILARWLLDPVDRGVNLGCRRDRRVEGACDAVAGKRIARKRGVPDRAEAGRSVAEQTAAVGAHDADGVAREDRRSRARTGAPRRRVTRKPLASRATLQPPAPRTTVAPARSAKLARQPSKRARSTFSPSPSGCIIDDRQARSSPPHAERTPRSATPRS